MTTNLPRKWAKAETEAAYDCENCGDSFHTKEGLIAHLRINH